jgi:hypothetical protein
MTVQVDDIARPEAIEERPPRSSRGRVRFAQLLAFVALVASLVGALGPAENVRTTYSWPPATLPSGAPGKAWFAPLLLLRHRPEAISATVPCVPPAPLRAAGPGAPVLATARFPERNGGLAITERNRRLTIRIGGELLRTVRLPAAAGESCAYELRLGNGRWSLSGGPEDLALGGGLGRMPVVSGLFSARDLRSEPRTSVEVTTVVHATDPQPHQAVAWTLAALCALAALFLVAAGRRPRPADAYRAARSSLKHARPADAVVGIVLVAWWVLSPAFADDGWVIARVGTFSTSGGFSAYYNSFGSNYPNDFWLEWLLHWIVESPLVVLRLVPLLCLAAVWVLCRWILGRVLQASVGESSVAPWALACAFLAGALAWGMTVRPEPVTALVVIAVLACTVRFLEKESAAPLAGAAVLIPLGLTGHHAALAAFAPLLVASPAILRWARTRIAAAATIVAASIALLVTLLFVGADLEQRRADARIAPLFQPDATWRDEVLRYLLLLDVPPFATPLRRASVALLLLAVVAFLLRARRTRQPLLDLPAASLGLALILFVATPTKHAWHFGALIGLAAVAVAAETARVRAEARVSRGWAIRPLVVLAAGIVVIAWSWFPRHPWNEVDLRTLDWTLGFEQSLSLASLAVALPVVLLVVLVAVTRLRGGGSGDVPWRVASWTAPLVVAPLLVFTLAVLAADAAKSDGWTLARQNLGSLAGAAGCGLADDLVVPLPDSARPLATVRGGEAAPVPAWVSPPPLAGLPRFALGPVAERSTARSPWFRIPADGRFGIFLSGTPSATDRLALEWGRLRAREVESLGRAGLAAGLEREAGATVAWDFLAAGELPAPADSANAVRVTLRADVAPGAVLAITSPVTYASAPLAERLEDGESRSLVMPSLVTLFPCAQLPVVSGGVVEPPDEILVPRSSTSPLRFPGSPFEGILDVYGLQRLSLADSPNPPREVVVFAVENRVPDVLEVPPVESSR